MGTITDKERIDEALELLWVLEEEGHTELNRFSLSSDDPDTDLIVEILIKDGLALISDTKILLTEKGRKTAKGLIRSQRLAERLFSDVFEMSDDSVVNDACKMEHILSEELTESVCTFLGHPPTCPLQKKPSCVLQIDETTVAIDPEIAKEIYIKKLK